MVVTIDSLEFSIRVIALALLTAMGCDSLLSFDGSTDRHNLSGPVAAQEFAQRWPLDADPMVVKSFSIRSVWSRDSSSTWIRVELPGEQAKVWSDWCHQNERPSTADLNPQIDDFIEGVEHVRPAPPDDGQTGGVPEWWQPPQQEYRATELMRWYQGYNSGVGGGVYTTFDGATDTLWLYDFSCQHHKLWVRGNAPKGDHFSTANSGAETAK